MASITRQYRMSRVYTPKSSIAALRPLPMPRARPWKFLKRQDAAPQRMKYTKRMWTPPAVQAGI